MIVLLMESSYITKMKWIVRIAGCGLLRVYWWARVFNCRQFSVPS